MVKPIIVTADCAANAVVAKDFLEADGAGAVKAFDGTGVALGIAETNKDIENRVGCIKQGLIKLPTTAAAYAFGDQVEWAAGQTVAAYSAGVIVGTAAESKTTTSGDNYLLVYVNFA